MHGDKKTKTTQLYGGLLQLIIRINRSNDLTWEHWLMLTPCATIGQVEANIVSWTWNFRVLGTTCPTGASVLHSVKGLPNVYKP